MRDTSRERLESLTLAAELHRRECPPCIDRILATANTVYEWLTGAVALIVIAGPTVDQTTGKFTGNPGGDIMKDSEKMALTVTAEDAKGQVTASGTDITFTSADETVASITTDENGTAWAVAGLPGSTVITGDWPDSPSGDISGTLAVDVTAGDAVSLQIAAGSPVPQ